MKKKETTLGTKTPKEVRQHLNQLREKMVQEETKLEDRLVTIQYQLDSVDRELDKIATDQNNCRFVRGREGEGEGEGTCEGECPSVGDTRSL